MANYDSKSSTSKDRVTRIYSDLDLDFMRNHTTSDLTKLEDVEAVKRSVKNLIQTNHYERPFHPEIGSDVRALLFENMTPQMSHLITKQIELLIANYEPRARVLQKIAEKVLKEKHLLDNKLFDLAKELEYLALNDDYFKEKKLYPNVDFYSGIILKAIGFPVSLFTVIFAVARTVGWISHWNEMISDQNSKIGRPRQLYTGKPQREFS